MPPRLMRIEHSCAEGMVSTRLFLAVRIWTRTTSTLVAMRVILIGIIMFAVNGGAFAAQEVPAEVSAHVADVKEACSLVGVPLAPEDTFLSSGDFNGDGITDWVVYDAGFKC